MKNLLPIFFCLTGLLATQPLLAQEEDSLLYKRFPNVPPFSIVTLPDSIPFSKKDLKARKPVLIFVFSPDCPHCQQTTRDMLNHYASLKDLQVVMATPLEYKWIIPFYEEYGIAQYPNIHMGRDATNFLGTFYDVKNYPALFLYNKKGKFVKAFRGHLSFENLLTYIR